MSDGFEWFAPKRYGYGAGMPVAWQGWLLLGIYVGIVAGTAMLAKERPGFVAAIVVPATMLLIFISARTTRGGWRWRWGDRDRLE